MDLFFCRRNLVYKLIPNHYNEIMRNLRVIKSTKNKTYNVISKSWLDVLMRRVFSLCGIFPQRNWQSTLNGYTESCNDKIRYWAVIIVIFSVLHVDGLSYFCNTVLSFKLVLKNFFYIRSSYVSARTSKLYYTIEVCLKITSNFACSNNSTSAFLN